MLILGIESTCDETGCAIVRDGTDILSNIVATQIDLHATYGGVFPELACRRHIDVMIPVIDEALQKANITLDDIDAIAVAQGPGLVGALLIGIHAAQSLAWSLQKPLIGVNHVEAHLYATLMDQSPKFPALGVVLSGGHTTLLKMHSIGHYEIIGQTIDDAIGEAFDKTAKILGLPYPGGPEIEKIAKSGNSEAYPFRPGRIKGRPLDFSFSGLKTRVLYTSQGLDLTFQQKCDIAATFQRTAVQDVINKARLAVEKHGCESLILGGGVTNNQFLRDEFSRQLPEIQCHWPARELTLDNAAMIAGLGFHKMDQYVEGEYRMDPSVRTQF